MIVFVPVAVTIFFYAFYDVLGIAGDAEQIPCDLTLPAEQE